MVHAKIGDHATAAAFYRQAFGFVTHPAVAITTTAGTTPRRDGPPLCQKRLAGLR